jgi:hypothetical protein
MRLIVIDNELGKAAIPVREFRGIRWATGEEYGELLVDKAEETYPITAEEYDSLKSALVDDELFSW